MAKAKKLGVLVALLILFIAGAFLMERYVLHHEEKPPVREGDLLMDVKNASAVAWVGPHPDDEIWASGLLALSSLGYDKKVYVVSLHNDPISFPPGADKYDRFQDNEDFKQFLELEEYVRWNLQEYPSSILEEKTKQLVKQYFLENNIDLFFTYENTHGATGHPEHIVASEWLTEFAQEENIKLYYVLNLDPSWSTIDGKTDPGPYTDEIDLDSYYVNSYLGYTSLWDVKNEVFEIYSSSVRSIWNFLQDPENVEKLIHKEYYRLVN